jgi:hypothetical protein
VYFSDVIHPGLFLSHLLKALWWADKSPEVDLCILSQADEVINIHTAELFPRFAALLASLCASGDASILSQIPFNNPTVLLNAEMNLEPVIEIFAASTDVGVCVALLEHYLLLFTCTPGHSSQEALRRAFRHMFERSSAAVMSSFVAV